MRKEAKSLVREAIVPEEQIEEAMVQFRDKLASDSSLQAAVELWEQERGWGGTPDDAGFGLAWEAMKPRLVGRIIKKGLLFPGARANGDERDFSMEAIFYELRKRATEEPVKLLEDALLGKLSNSLVLSAERDVRDEIRRLKPKATKQVSIEDEEYAVANIIPAMGEDVDVEENWDEIVSCLSEEEKTVLVLLYKEELRQTQVAATLHKSQPWVSKVRQRALEKCLRSIRTSYK